METLSINILKGYDITIGAGLLSSVGERVAALGNYNICAVVTDKTVEKLYLATVLTSLTQAGLKAEAIAVEVGEGSKSLQTLGELYNFYAKINLTRTDVIVYVGGGVVGDLAGFSAATYLRGVDYVAVPTTLLAMLDSSVGGKTAINTDAGKNLAGAFYQPRAVLVDPKTLGTLAKEDFCCGVGEALKYAMIADPSMLLLLAGELREATMTELILRGLKVKKRCVEQDTFDTGVRQTLNFGHTFGHVIEKDSQYTISHGVAVGIGMAMITRWAEERGFTEAGTASVIEGVLNRFHMPTSYPLLASELFALAKNDKKRRGSKLTLVLLTRVGECYLKEIDVE